MLAAIQAQYRHCNDVDLEGLAVDAGGTGDALELGVGYQRLAGICNLPAVYAGKGSRVIASGKTDDCHEAG